MKKLLTIVISLFGVLLQSLRLGLRKIYLMSQETQ